MPLVLFVVIACAAMIGVVAIDGNYAANEGRTTCTVTQMMAEVEHHAGLPERRTVRQATLKCDKFTLNLRSHKQKVFTQGQWNSLAVGGRFECEHIVSFVFRDDNPKDCKKIS